MTDERASDSADFDDVASEEALRLLAASPPKSPPQWPAVGQKWGPDNRFEILERVGEGGSGVVYRAREHRGDVHQIVALKILKRASGEWTDRFKKRLIKEGGHLSDVNSRYVAQVFYYGFHEEIAFVVMDFIANNLRAQLACGLNEKEIVRISCEILKALIATHERDIGHLDLKPDNVLLSRDGTVKLTDFGIATVVFDTNEEAVTSAVPESMRRIEGTPVYMAPEQFKGENVGKKADLYSWAVVSFEMVEGRVPFPQSVARQRALTSIPATPSFTSERWCGMPNVFRGTVETCLSVDPQSRVPSASVLLEMLREGARQRESQSIVPVASEESSTKKPRAITNWRKATIAGVAAIALSSSVMIQACPFGYVRRDGMILFAAGPTKIGRTAAQANEECIELGGECIVDKVNRETPAHYVILNAYYLDVDEVRTDPFVKWLNSFSVEMLSDPDLPQDGKPIVTSLNDHTRIGDTRNAPFIRRADGYFEAREGQANRPVVLITWDAAQAYCRDIGKRLPTEAEWENAARGAADRKYPWGNEEPTCAGVIFARDKGQKCESMPGHTEDVGTARQDITPQGIRGLGGNASEWVQDSFVGSHYEDCHLWHCWNPVASSTQSVLRVTRGGDVHSSIFSRTYNRGRFHQHEVANDLGFRCASTASE